MKTTLPVALGFVVGLFMLVQFFVPHPKMQAGYNEILDWKQIVIGMTYILGVWSLMQFHGKKIRRRVEGWGYSAVALVGFVVTVILGAIGVFTGRNGGAAWVFENVQSPMQSTMFALLAFFVASASYRAFRARSVHATLLLVAGVIVMLGRVPVGGLVQTNIGGETVGLSSVATFILDVPNLAAKRGILIGVGLGVCATALKILLGIERTYLGKGTR
jgi:hypothetical protein